MKIYRMGRTIGIDASRNRSGGARAHLIGVLTGSDPREFGISRVHVWAHKTLHDVLPNKEWLHAHCPDVLTNSMAKQLLWQFRSLPKIVQELGCDVLFNTDAGSVCPFRPCVTMSQDMLSFEPGEMQRFGFTKSRLRLEALKHVQASSLKRAEVAVFLTNHAAQTIQREIGKVAEYRIINHGIGDEFRINSQRKTGARPEPFEFLYVSNAALYKHQWSVVQAIGKVRKKLGLDIRLKLVGGGTGEAQQLLEKSMSEHDPDGAFIKQLHYVDNKQIPKHLAEANAFVFASSCENMPVTLLEAMASGLPIVCSDRGPMPEILEDGGLYFDPENPETIAKAMEQMLSNDELRSDLANQALSLAQKYSWERCSRETWQCLSKVANKGSVE